MTSGIKERYRRVALPFYFSFFINLTILDDRLKWLYMI